MKTNIAILIAAFAFVVQKTSAQQSEEAQQAAQPNTKLQQFQAKTGSVIVMGYAAVGTIKGKYGESVAVEVREFTDASNGAKQSGVVITVTKGERDAASYIDADEIESLIKGINYIGGLKASMSKLPGFQADYNTKDNLHISTFSTKDRELAASVKAGRIYKISAFITIADLAQIRDLLNSALTMLQKLK